MSKYDKIRFLYLYSSVNANKNSYKMDAVPSFQKHPHTCLAIKINEDTNHIEFSIARRESPGGIIWLKRRMQKIQELGGIVPMEMLIQLKSLRKNFTKKQARFIACRRLESNPRKIKIDCSELTAHEISRYVMEAIVDEASFKIFEATVAEAMATSGLSLDINEIYNHIMPDYLFATPDYVREAAREWLAKNVEQRITLDSIVSDTIVLDENHLEEDIGSISIQA